MDLSFLIDMPVPQSLEELLQATELIVVGRATEALEVSTVMTGPSEFSADTPDFKRFRSSRVTYTVRFELDEIITGATPCEDIALTAPLGPFMDSGARELLFLAVDPRSGRYHPVGGPWTGRWLVDDDGIVRSLYAPSTDWWFAGVIDGQSLDAVRRRLG